MSLPRWLQALRPLWLEFWLPLPLLGIIFWLGGNVVTSQVLSRPYSTVSKLQADAQQEVQLSVTVLVIKAEIEKNEGLTQVEVKTADPELKTLEFQFPVTEVTQVEARIAQKLGLSREDTKKLVRYQVKN
jgi:HD-GYP domain-containing protein (c-di-GMP phosphodiesterase class II)